MPRNWASRWAEVGFRPKGEPVSKKGDRRIRGILGSGVAKPEPSVVRGPNSVIGERKPRNLPAFPAHWIDLHRSHVRDHEKISSETDSTPPPRRRPAPNPKPARPTGHRTLARA